MVLPTSLAVQRLQTEQAMTDWRDTSWMGEGKCRKVPPETMFPSIGAGVNIARAQSAVCPVQQACLEYTLVHHIEHGVWGGTSERQRRRIASARRRHSLPV